MGLKGRRGGTLPAGGQGSAGEALVARLREQLLDEVDLDELSTLTETQRRARLERIVGHLVTREGPVLSSAERSSLIRRVVDEALGLGVLEPLHADDTVTEIMVNGPHDIWVEGDGRLEPVDTQFVNDAQMYQTIDRIHQEGLTVLLVEQNARLALQLANYGYVMEVGRVVLEGPSAELARDEGVKRAYIGA